MPEARGWPSLARPPGIGGLWGRGGEFARGLFRLALRALFGLVSGALVRFEGAARGSAFRRRRSGSRGGGGDRRGRGGGRAARGRAEDGGADGAAREQRACDGGGRHAF